MPTTVYNSYTQEVFGTNPTSSRRPRLVIFSGDDSDLHLTFATIKQLTLVDSDPFLNLRVVIFLQLQLPEAKIGVKLLVSTSLHRAVLLHIFLHESVNFMIDECGLQLGIGAGFAPHDLSVLEVRMVLLHLAR